MLFGLLLLGAVCLEAQTPTKRIVILSSYEPNYPGLVILQQSLTSTIKNNSAGRIEFFYEFQENSRISNAKYETEMIGYLKRKYEGENINLIVAVGAPALKFLLKNESNLFTAVPKVYYFHDETEQEAHTLWPHVTGVFADLDLEKNIQMALALRPDTENVFIVSGNSAQDKFLQAEAEKELRPYHDRLRINYLTDVTIDELKEKTASLPPRSVIIYLAFFVDKQGNSFAGPEALSRFAPTANAPIFGVAETYLGAGIVGGSVLDFHALGTRLGEISLNILGGATAYDITPQTAANETLADARELRRWKLDEKKLPPSTVVRFRDPTVWDRYKSYVLAIAVVLSVQAAVIAWLLLTRTRRREAKSEEKTRAIFRAIPDLMFLQSQDGTYLDYHARDTKDLLVPPQRFLGKNMRDILPRELSEDFRRSFERAKGGETQVVEYKLPLNGTERWFEAHIVASGENMLSVIREITSHKQTENALRQSQAQLTGIIGSAMDGIITIDEKETIVLFNATAEKIFGCSAAEAIGKSIDRFIPQRYRALHHDHVREFAQAKETNRQIGSVDLYGVRASGEEFPMEASISHTEVDGNKFFTVILRDITERKRALDELSESEQRFAKAFRANPQPMSLTTIPDGVYIDVNDSFLAMSGYLREEVIGRSAVELNVWESPSDRVAFFEELDKNEFVINYEMKFRRKDGSFRNLLLSSERLENFGRSCLLVASSDVTEFMAAQQASRESEARFRNMADTAPVMIWVSDETKECTYFNKQWLDFTGKSLEKELGHGWTDGIHPDDRQHCLQVYNSSFEQAKKFEMEYRLRRYDGAYRWVFDCGAPRFSADGGFLGYIGSCIDITERKQADIELRQAHEELSQLKNQLEAENIYLQEELQLDQTFGEIIGQSDAIKYVLFKVTEVAPTGSTVLITGETGTGKELVARAIHGASSRKDRPLIKVNCAALSSNLIESELFGHEKGAFTGATARKLGRFELATGGTIFLDEIGELPPELQVKLLRVIQEGEFERVGGTTTIQTDVRIIAATNKNLKDEVKKGAFREDLWYRLNVFPITVPPLRQRKEDIPLLAEHFIAKFAKRSGKTITSVSPRVLQALQLHSWPGNIRELANAIERAVIHTHGNVLQSVVTLEQKPEVPSVGLKTLDDIERDHIMRTLESTGWRIEGPYGAAKILGLNPSTLRTRMIKHGIQRRHVADA